MFTTLDWIFLGLLGLSIALGFWRGLVWELMSMGGWFVAGAAAFYGAPYLSPYLAMTDLSVTLRYTLALVLIYITVWILWKMLASAIKNAVGAVGMGSLDRLLGGVFGLARGALFLTVAVTVLSYTPVQSTDFWQTSSGVKLCQAAAQLLKPYLPANAAELIP
jgi:membrane protein required for colicin V production